MIEERWMDEIIIQGTKTSETKMERVLNTI